ncbi:MAG: YqiA/YcfP family alpha/beta fold hydrolase [Betaproteobacteria bacterium]
MGGGGAQRRFGGSAITIFYLHGFNSSPHSVKGQMLARAAAALPEPPAFHVPALVHRPAQAMRDVCAWVDAEVSSGRNLAFVGSSLGGYYATWLAEKYSARAVVINPAVRPWVDLKPFFGPQRNPYTGEAYEVTPAHFDELAALAVARITRPEHYFLLARTGDEVLDWRAAAAFYAGAFQYVASGGDHGWEDFGAEVPSVLRFVGCVK